MKTRIYVYKITFEEVPYWYWGVHKEKKYGEVYWGTPVSHKWVWSFHTPKIQILQIFDSWEEAKLIEDRLIRPDLNNTLCLNEAVGFHMSLESCSRGGVSAAKLAKEQGFGFYGPKTEKQLESSRREGSKLSQYSVENGSKTGKENVVLGRGIWGLTKEEQVANASKAGKVGGKLTGAQKWEDPDHPELGQKPACVLVSMQKRRGHPHGPQNRIRIG
jgi:hypothetical protein